MVPHEGYPQSPGFPRLQQRSAEKTQLISGEEAASVSAAGYYVWTTESYAMNQTALLNVIISSFHDTRAKLHACMRTRLSKTACLCQLQACLQAPFHRKPSWLSHGFTMKIACRSGSGNSYVCCSNWELLLTVRLENTTLGLDVDQLHVTLECLQDFSDT
jgi:hypothetical protein